jgi:hypothetical protein
MKVTILLADAAQAVNGKLYILGGGWSITGPDPTVGALAVKIEIPWTEANRPHDLRLVLVDEDERQVRAGDQAIEIAGRLEVGRPPGLPPGTPLDAVFAINHPPFPLEPGRRYVWRLYIDGNTREDWNVAFITRQRPEQARQ